MAVGLFIIAGPSGPAALVDIDPASVPAMMTQVGSKGVFFFHLAIELTVYA